jgi:hypothetical protein
VGKKIPALLNMVLILSLVLTLKISKKLCIMIH